MDARRAKLEAIIIIAAESLGVSPGTSVSIVPIQQHINTKTWARPLTLLRHHRV